MADTLRNGRRLNVVPDALDLRDRLYQPRLDVVSVALDIRKSDLRPNAVADQKQTSACTGFAVAAVVEHLLRASGREQSPEVSPFMLYHNARKYDEFPGMGDVGSSLRGCLKGWYKHGVCRDDLWDARKRPRLTPDPENDWWRDGARRPLGAYYRIDVRSVTDMHVALSEVGILAGSAICHAGWDEGFELSDRKRKDWTIPVQPAASSDGGHAFAIVGYDSRGFLVLNSWSDKWGDGGYGRLLYEDWIANAMDCWVCQLGVPTSESESVAAAATLRSQRKGRQLVVRVAADVELRNQELSPFIINVENDGQLSSTGQFQTDAEDLEDLINHHLPLARQAWGREQGPVDVAIYAHGGLNDESAAAGTAARWIPELYAHQIFPVFLMWESGLWKTLQFVATEWLNDAADSARDRWNDFTDSVRDRWSDATDTIGGWWSRLTSRRRMAGSAAGDFWNERVERLLARPGTAIWSEMKENAEAITTNANKENGLQALLKAMSTLKKKDFRLHAIGHSAGCIALAPMVAALAKNGWTIGSVQYLAPALRIDAFHAQLAPLIADGTVGRYAQFHLSDERERADRTARYAAGYNRSLLYLVSHSFEGGGKTPILGMQADFDADDGIAQLLAKAGDRIDVIVSPRETGAVASRSGATVHGAFDDDEATIAAVIRRIHATGQ